MSSSSHLSVWLYLTSLMIHQRAITVWPWLSTCKQFHYMQTVYWAAMLDHGTYLSTVRWLRTWIAQQWAMIMYHCPTEAISWVSLIWMTPPYLPPLQSIRKDLSQLWESTSTRPPSPLLTAPFQFHLSGAEFLAWATCACKPEESHWCCLCVIFYVARNLTAETMGLSSPGTQGLPAIDEYHAYFHTQRNWEATAVNGGKWGPPWPDIQKDGKFLPLLSTPAFDLHWNGHSYNDLQVGS